MPREQLIIGVLMTLLCAAGALQADWFLRETPKGQALERRFGRQRAVWLLRGLFGAGLVFGILLATNIVRPVHW